MKMEKTVSILFALLLCLAVLQGCAQNKPDGTSSTPESTESVLPSGPTETEAPQSTTEESSEVATSVPTESRTPPTSTAPPTTSKPNTTTTPKPPTTSSTPPTSTPTNPYSLPNLDSFEVSTAVRDGYTITVRCGVPGLYLGSNNTGSPDDKPFTDFSVLPLVVQLKSTGNTEYWYAAYGSDLYRGWYPNAPKWSELGDAYILSQSFYIPADKLSSATLTVFVGERINGVVQLDDSNKFIFVWNGSKLVIQ